MSDRTRREAERSGDETRLRVERCRAGLCCHHASYLDPEACTVCGRSLPGSPQVGRYWVLDARWWVGHPAGTCGSNERRVCYECVERLSSVFSRQRPWYTGNFSESYVQRSWPRTMQAVQLLTEEDLRRFHGPSPSEVSNVMFNVTGEVPTAEACARCGRHSPERVICDECYARLIGHANALLRARAVNEPSHPDRLDRADLEVDRPSDD